MKRIVGITMLISLVFILSACGEASLKSADGLYLKGGSDKEKALAVYAKNIDKGLTPVELARLRMDIAEKLAAAIEKKEPEDKMKEFHNIQFKYDDNFRKLGPDDKMVFLQEIIKNYKPEHEMIIDKYEYPFADPKYKDLVVSLIDNAEKYSVDPIFYTDKYNNQRFAYLKGLYDETDLKWIAYYTTDGTEPNEKSQSVSFDRTLATNREKLTELRYNSKLNDTLFSLVGEHNPNVAVRLFFYFPQLDKKTKIYALNTTDKSKSEFQNLHIETATDIEINKQKLEKAKLLAASQSKPDPDSNSGKTDTKAIVAEAIPKPSDSVANNKQLKEDLKRGKLNGLGILIGDKIKDVMQVWGKPDQIVPNSNYVVAMYKNKNVGVYYTDMESTVFGIDLVDNFTLYGLKVGADAKEIEKVLGKPDGYLEGYPTYVDSTGNHRLTFKKTKIELR